MNKNSIKAYHEIVDDGTLTKAEANVYKIIKHHGPINNRQIDDLTHGQGHKRTKALLDSGAIYGVDKVDPVTNKTSCYYSVTGEIPVKVKRPTRKTDIDLSGFYDKAFENGVVAAIMYFVPFADPDEIANRANEICEGMK